MRLLSIVVAVILLAGVAVAGEKEDLTAKKELLQTKLEALQARFDANNTQLQLIQVLNAKIQDQFKELSAELTKVEEGLKKFETPKPPEKK